MLHSDLSVPAPWKAKPRPGLANPHAPVPMTPVRRSSRWLVGPSGQAIWSPHPGWLGDTPGRGEDLVKTAYRLGGCTLPARNRSPTMAPCKGSDAVTSDRRQSILSRIAESGDSSPDQLCRVCRDVTATSGVGIMLRADGVTRGSLGTTDAVSSLIEELQFMLGEGPCIDAYKREVPIAEPDLADPTSRWLGFTPLVFKAGVRALFAFPLRVGAVCLGSLDLYRDRAGTLSDNQHLDALIMADIVSQSVLTMQAEASPDELAELDALMTPLNVVYQAVGMVSAQLGGSVDDSLIRLKAHAFASDRLLTGLAQDVVARRMRFDAAGEAQRVTS